MQKKYQTLYEQTGYLFYSIASIDNKISMQEIEKIKEIVKQQWLALENSTDIYGSDAAHYIFITFDYLLAETGDSSTAWESFASFYNANKSLFTADIKQLILKSANDIAQATAGVNKAESISLKKLEMLFE